MNITTWLSLDYSRLPHFPLEYFEDWSKRQDRYFHLTRIFNDGYAKIVIDFSNIDELYLVMSVIRIGETKSVETYQTIPDRVDRLLLRIKKKMWKELKFNL